MHYLTRVVNVGTLSDKFMFYVYDQALHDILKNKSVDCTSEESVCTRTTKFNQYKGNVCCAMYVVMCNGYYDMISLCCAKVLLVVACHVLHITSQHLMHCTSHGHLVCVADWVKVLDSMTDCEPKSIPNKIKPRAALRALQRFGVLLLLYYCIVSSRADSLNN